MDTQLASQVGVARTRRSGRALAVHAIGPLTAVGGVVWAVAQPWRITLLHPHGQGFWWLVVEPPLLVILVGAIFALLVAPGVLDDLALHEEEER